MAADGRDLAIVPVVFNNEPWLASTDREFRQPYADGEWIVWIEQAPGPFPTYRLRAHDCVSGEQVELDGRAYETGQIDVPVVDDGIALWLDWRARGSDAGHWRLRSAVLGTRERGVVLSSQDWPTEPGAAGRRPLVPEPALDDSVFITWLKTADEVTNILVGTLGSDASLVTEHDGAGGGVQAGPDVDVSGMRSVFMQRSLADGPWTWDIWLYEQESGSKRRLTDAVADGVTYELPHIDGNYVGYVETTPAGNGVYVPYLHDLETDERVALSAGVSGSRDTISQFALSGGWIAWTTSESLRLASVNKPSTVYEIATPNSIRQLEIHEGSIVWTSTQRDPDSGRAESYRIYWLRLPESL